MGLSRHYRPPGPIETSWGWIIFGLIITYPAFLFSFFLGFSVSNLILYIIFWGIGGTLLFTGIFSLKENSKGKIKYIFNKDSFSSIVVVCFLLLLYIITIVALVIVPP